MQAFDAGRVPPITFGAGRLAEVGAIAAALGSGPVLVVADKILAELGVTARLTAALDSTGLGVEMAAEIAGEPKEAVVDALATRARDTGAGVVVGIGGGAAMDAAKLVAAIAPSGRPAADFALGANDFPESRLPAIAIPPRRGRGPR